MSGAKKPAEAQPAKRDEVMDLLRRAEAGDESTLPMVRELMNDGPLVESIGNLALQVQETLIRNASGKNLPFKAALGRKISQLRKDLAGETPTPLERLLAERIALCWLSLHDAEIRFAQAADWSIRQAAYWQDRIDRAHRRYLSAIRTLATIRKLAVPALQVNIARKQVNVASRSAPAGGKQEEPWRAPE